MYKKRKGLIILSLILIQSIFFLINLPENVNAFQDDSDLGVTIHGSLLSQGNEIYGDSLIPCGTYAFFETPELNTGSYSHDLTRMSIVEVQKLFENSTSEYTNESEHSISSGLGVQTLETNQTINEYTLSAPKDTSITIYANFSITGDFFQNTADIEHFTESGSFKGIFFDDLLDRYYTVDYSNKRIYQYDTSFNYIEYQSIASVTNPITVCRGSDNSFYILDTSSQIHKYSQSWVTYYGIVATLTEDTMTDLIYAKGYFYTTGGSASPNARIYQYDTSFNYIAQSTHGSPISVYDTMQSIIYVPQYDKFFVANDLLSTSAYVYQFSSDLSLDFEGGNAVKYSSDLFAKCSEGGLLFNGYSFWGHIDATDTIWRKTSYNFFNFSTVNATNVQYSILNTNYTQNCTLDTTDFVVNMDTNQGSCTFSLNSSQFDYYDYSSDLKILTQNITFAIDKIVDVLSLTVYILVNFSYSLYKVPTEIDLKVNNEVVIDQGHNSGFITFDEFPNSLEFNSNEDSIYFEFNSTSYFIFDIELEIISRTYLRKDFKLLSDHGIYLETIYLPEEIIVVKSYLNNIELDNENPIYLPIVFMDINNIFIFEVLLTNELYIPLQYTYGGLGEGSSDFYLFGLSNSISYNNANRFDDFSITTPSGFNTEYVNLSFSDLKYTPDYTSDPSQNIHNSSVEQNQEILEPEIQYFNSTEQLEYYNILNTSESVNSTFIEYGSNTTNLDNTYELDNNNFNVSSYIDHTGLFNATYSFTTDNDGDDPTGWIVEYEQSGCTVNVISGVENHDKVLELFRIIGTNRMASVYQLFDSQSSGTIEFWFRSTDNSRSSSFYIYGDSQTKNALFLELANLIPQSNIWYHIRIDFDCITDTYDLIVRDSEGILSSDYDIPFSVNIDVGIDKIYFGTQWGASAQYSFYLDAIGYSWDEYYDIGDNLKDEIYNITSEFQFNFSEALTLEDIKAFNMSYNTFTNISQTLNVSIYNFVSESYELINSSDFNSYYTNIYERNNRTQNYFDSDLGFNISIIGLNSSDNFNISIDYLNLVIEYYNGTILSVAPSLSLVFSNPLFVNQSYNFTVVVEKSCYEIDTIWFWDNITENNQTIGNSEGFYNITVNFTQAGYYNFSIFANSTQGSYRMINASFLSVIEMGCYLDEIGLYNGYFQNNSFSFNITMRDYLSTPLANKLVNISLTNETYSTLLNESFYTDEFGNINYNFTNNFTLLGFYHFNFSFYSNSYLNYSKTMSFEVLPYERAVNSSDIELKVNTYDVIDNFIQINYTSSISIECIDNTTFDLDVNLALNYTESISYERLLSYSFSFDATTQINYINCSIANITNSPTNFSYYYYNNELSSNYVLFGNNLEVSDLIDTTLFNQNEFKVDLVYYQDERVRTQITENPSTDSNSVIFQEYLLANRSFSYWYFSDSLTVNSVSLYHIRTGTTINTFEINNSKYYFEEDCLANDLFNATINYNPNWDIDFEILVNNGTYSQIKVDYQADLSVSNVSLSLDLSSSGCYNDNWTLNASQSSINYKLTIPRINFSTTLQTFYIEGVSSIPYVSLSSYESDQAWNQIAVDNTIDFIYLVDFPKFSTIFLANINENWDCYNFYYGTKTYAIESMSNILIKITGVGFDPSISDSYIHFTTNPFTTVDFDYSDELITITIVSTLAVENCYFKTPFDPTGAHTLEVISDIELHDLTDTGDSEGYIYFYVDLIEEGTTIIKIRCNFATPEEFILQSLLPFILGGVFIGLYFYLKRNEHILKDLKAKIENWEESRKGKGEKGVSKASFEIKDNKIYFTPEED